MTTATLNETPLPSRPESRPAQQSALARIAGWCHDHRWWVLIIWLVALVATNVFAQAAGSAFTNNLTGGKQTVQQILNANFPAQAGSPAQVVITTSTPFTDPANQARTTQLVNALRRLPHVSGGGQPIVARRGPPDLA